MAPASANKMLKWRMTCTELIRYKYKICYDIKTDVHNIYAQTKDPTPEA